MTDYVYNKKSGATHIVGGYDKYSDASYTVCGIEITDQYPVTEKIATCQICKKDYYGDEHSEFGDPLGILDDDLPDGAYWAMHNELYGGGF